MTSTGNGSDGDYIYEVKWLLNRFPNAIANSYPLYKDGGYVNGMWLLWKDAQKMAYNEDGIYRNWTDLPIEERFEIISECHRIASKGNVTTEELLAGRDFLSGLGLTQFRGGKKTTRGYAGTNTIWAPNETANGAGNWYKQTVLNIYNNTSRTYIEANRAGEIISGRTFDEKKGPIWVDAIIYGNLNKNTRFVDKFNVNTQTSVTFSYNTETKQLELSPNGRTLTPLITAAIVGNNQSLQFLLDRGANINGTNKEGDTPIMAATCNGNVAMVQALFERGAKVQIKGQHESLLTIAVKSGNQQMIDAVLGLKYKDGKPAVNIDALNQKTGRNALMAAVEAGNVEATKKLVKAGADVNLTASDIDANGTKHEKSPLHMALALSLPHAEVDKNNKPVLDKTGKPKQIQPTAAQKQVAIDCAKAIFESENLDIKKAREDLDAYQKNPNHDPDVLKTLNDALAAKEAPQQQTQEETQAPSPEDQVPAKPEPKKVEVTVARHQYSGKRKGKVMSHEDVIEFAATRNVAQMKPEEHQQAIARIQEMENQGLLPKGPNGSSNAEVYLYRARQSSKYYHKDEEIKMADGTYQPVRQALASNDVNHKNVVSMLTGSDNIDAQSADVAKVLLRTEGCISATGEARTDHRIPVKNNKSFQAGMASGIEIAAETEIIETPITPQTKEGAEQPAPAGAGQQGQKDAEQPAQAGAKSQVQEGAKQPEAPEVPSTGASQGAKEQAEPAEKTQGLQTLRQFTLANEEESDKQGVFQSRNITQQAETQR